MATAAIEYPRIIAPLAGIAATPEEAAKGHRTVTMVFDHPVLLTVDWHHKIQYPKGVHEVPEHLADHYYLVNNNVRPYNRPMAVSAIVKPNAAQTAKLGKSARSKGR